MPEFQGDNNTTVSKPVPKEDVRPPLVISTVLSPYTQPILIVLLRQVVSLCFVQIAQTSQITQDEKKNINPV